MSKPLAIAFYKIMKKQLEKLSRQLSEGYYDEWAKGFLHDSKLDIAEADIVNIAKDFIECRIIELED